MKEAYRAIDVLFVVAASAVWMLVLVAPPARTTPSTLVRPDLQKRRAEEKTGREIAMLRDTIEVETANAKAAELWVCALEDGLTGAGPAEREFRRSFFEIQKAGLERAITRLVAATSSLDARVPPEPVSYLRSCPNIGDLAVEPKIDGVVARCDGNRFRISAGRAKGVQAGMKFTVYSDAQYHSKLVVLFAGRDFSDCCELREFRKTAIEPGDLVSTRVYD